MDNAQVATYGGKGADPGRRAGGVNAPIELTDIDLDLPRAGEVLVRIAASGLCGSDLNAISGKRTLVPFPAVLGHEASGEVVACGRHSPGQR